MDSGSGLETSLPDVQRSTSLTNRRELGASARPRNGSDAARARPIRAESVSCPAAAAANSAFAALQRPPATASVARSWWADARAPGRHQAPVLKRVYSSARPEILEISRAAAVPVSTATVQPPAFAAGQLRGSSVSECALGGRVAPLYGRDHDLNVDRAPC